MIYEKGHGQYIVECAAEHSCMDVFKDPSLPPLGVPYHGQVVTDIKAERLAKDIYLLTLTVDPVA